MTELAPSSWVWYGFDEELIYSDSSFSLTDTPINKKRNNPSEVIGHSVPEQYDYYYYWGIFLPIIFMRLLQ